MQTWNIFKLYFCTFDLLSFSLSTLFFISDSDEGTQLSLILPAVASTLGYCHPDLSSLCTFTPSHSQSLPTYTFQGTLRTNILYGIHYNLGDLHGLVLGLSKVFRNRDCNLASQKGNISVPLLIGAICIWIFITKTRCEMGLDIGRPILLNVLRYITQTEPSCWLNLCNHRFIPTKTQTYGDPQNCL